MVDRTFAVEYVRRMRGGTQSQLLRCADGAYYVVKFQNNPQGTKALANDLLGTLLAMQLGLPVPQPSVVYVSPEIVLNSEEMVIQGERGSVPCFPGWCFGSRYPSNEERPSESSLAVVCEFVSDGRMRATENVQDLAGMLVFDKWTCNTDDRQVLFYRHGEDRTYRVMMIDQGGCFDGIRWAFPDAPWRGVYRNRAAYTEYGGFDSFEPWLSRLETEISGGVLRQTASEIPPEWYGWDESAMTRLLDRLDRRRKEVRGLLWSLVSTSPELFPHWSDQSFAMKSRAASVSL